MAQEKLLAKEAKQTTMGAQTDVPRGKPLMLKTFKWVAKDDGYE